MTPATSTDVLARLDKLERQNRWLKRLALTAVLVAGTGLLMAAQNAPAKKTVEANHVSLRDDAGNERGYARATPDGLALVFTAGGGPRSGLVLTSDGVYFQLLDGTAKPLTGLSLQNNGVCMGFRSGQDRVEIGNTAIKAVLGQSLTPIPLLAKPGQ